MSGWNKLDIGKIIVYKSKPEIGTRLTNETVAIYDIYSKFPDMIRGINYPIAFPSKVTSVIGLVKDQEKEEYLKQPGDWCFLGRVSIDEMGELERIAKAPKVPLNEDLSSPDTFR